MEKYEKIEMIEIFRKMKNMIFFHPFIHTILYKCIYTILLYLLNSLFKVIFSFCK
jgi:hypothetical protein